MRKIVLKRALGYVLASVALALGFSPASVQLSNFPDRIYVSVGHIAELNLASPVRAELVPQQTPVISSFDQSIDEAGSVVTMQSAETGDAQFVLKLLGIPVKTVQVSVQPSRMVMPGGQSIGVAIQSQGVLVVGASDIGAMPSPARLAGLRSGDLIEKVDGIQVESAKHLSELISSGETVELDVLRGDDLLCISLTPALDQRDSTFRLGAWVRDSTAGVGTLSFYDAETHAFGALGHAITDIDTGTLVSVGDGGIFESQIIDIRRGISGEPGELVGQFSDTLRRLGDFYSNTDYGIYGECYDPLVNELYPEGLPIATRDEVKIGPAQILTTLDGGGVKAYDCQIVKLVRQDDARQRSMVVEVTDEELLLRTGGIVQGMSGSPIVQDGRMVGAVTHVFVNDPTHGYGVYIEWMLEQCA